jgi:hypothetical protein
MFFTACSSHDGVEDSKDDTKELKGPQFTLTEVPYGVDTEVSTRSTETVAKTDTLNFGNGIEGEVTVMREPEEKTKAATRTEISNQHYTIKALSTTGQLLATLKGTVGGTGTTKTFTPGAGTPHEIELPPGTYTFICFNDAFTESGASISVNADKAGEALYGYTTQTISGQHYLVNFEMKHLAVRMRVELTAYWDINGIKAVIGTPTGHGYLASSNITEMVSMANTPVVTSDLTLPTVTTEASNYTYTSTSDYRYFLASPDLSGIQSVGYYCKFTAGALYGRSVVGKSLDIGAILPTRMQPNESYKIKVTLYYSYRYLFHDGSVATLVQGKRAGKTAVAAMISNNKAMALTDAGSACHWSNTQNSVQTTHASTEFNAIYHDVDGFNHTWSASHSRTGVALGTDPNFPAFYQAAHYTPLKPLTGTAGTTTSWYLPAIGEWALAAQAEGNYNPASLTSWPNEHTHQTWNERLMKVVNVQAGGTTPVWGGSLGWYWASNEYSASSGYQIITYPNSTYGFYFAANPKATPFMAVRPFIIKN